MTKYTHTERLNCDPSALWQVITDVAHWSMWDPEVESAQLEGLFRLGTKGTIKHKNGASSKFSVLMCDVGQSYIISTTLALGVEMLTKRTWEKQGNELLFTTEITLIGPMAPIFMRMRKEGLSHNIPAGMQAIKTMVEPKVKENLGFAGDSKRGTAY